jgi:hypothetical protein
VDNGILRDEFVAITDILGLLQQGVLSQCHNIESLFCPESDREPCLNHLFLRTFFNFSPLLIYLVGVLLTKASMIRQVFW